jgi:glucokinase-like ROK family protein
MKQAATASLMRSINRSAILNLIRTESPIARTAIAQRLNMSLPTVMRVVETLVAEDLICFHGSEPSGGRRRPLLEFKGSAYAVIGIDLGGTKMYGTVTDLTGTIQHEVHLAWEHNGGAANALASLYQLIEELIAAPRPAGQKIRGIGVGAPGVTLSASGTVVWAPSLGWRDLPLKAHLSRRFNLPVFVENDVNAATLGEFGFGVERATPNLVCVAIGTGIGSGIIIDGKLYRGHNQAAGEVGYFLPGTEFLGRRYDEFGALESLASGTGIAARARRFLEHQNTPLAAQNVTSEDVFQYAREGHIWAAQIIDETVNYLSHALAAVCALLDPEAIVIGGGVARSADLLIEPIKQRLDGVIPFLPRIVASDLGPRAVVMGTIMLVLDATLGHVVVHQRS